MAVPVRSDLRAGAALTTPGRARLGGLARTLASLDPAQVLARGFAIVRDETGVILPRAEPARAARALEIEFADGRLRARPDRPPRKPGGDPGPAQGSLL
jgi:exodeoxyribonuclease VII large subunit